MLLTRLEAKGFKSFGDKISLQFGKGVTAVVGTNGNKKNEFL
jgi:chromosome segregation protein